MDKKINISWDILVKKVRWGLTPEEESAFREWLAQDKSHEVYFERVRKVWDADEPTSSLKSNLSKVMTRFDAYVEKEKELRPSSDNAERVPVCCLFTGGFDRGGRNVVF